MNYLLRLYYDEEKSPKDLYNKILKDFLKEGEEFEIRNFRENLGVIKEYIKFGKFSPEDGTDSEISIKGMVNEALIKKLLSFTPTELKNYWTPYFTLNLPNFSSSHQGEEIHFIDINQKTARKIEALIGEHGELSEMDEENPFTVKVEPLSDIEMEELAKAIKSMLKS